MNSIQRIAACLLILGPGGAAIAQDKGGPAPAPSRIQRQDTLIADQETADIRKRIANGNLPTIQFEIDSWDILPQSAPTLDALAEVMRRNPRIKLMITAHTCSLGKPKYNLWLSEKRAKSVKGELVKRGVPPPSIRFRGKGQTEPIADNNTEEGRSKNRRVEFKFLSRWWSSVY